MTIYEGAFRNIETNVDNTNIQQIIAVRIFDRETSVFDNPFNGTYSVSNNGDGTQTVIVTWNPNLITSTFLFFGYNNGGWVDTELDKTKGSFTITITEGDYTYSFSGDETRYELTQGATIPLEMAEPPLKISVVDNDEDKFTPIRSKQAEIQIYSNNSVDISTFSEGGDNRFYVEIETQAEGVIFKGFLSISDLQQEFLPDPNIIILVASDGLGFLKDEPLVNFEGENPLGIYQIIDFIAWSLAKTGLYLDIKICMNIREHTSVPLVSDDSGAGHLYSWIYLDARTFESEIGECENCYEVLTKILGENSYLVQYKGKWVIVRVDEMETGHEYFFSKYAYDGTWIENTEETFIKNIGAVYPLSFMNDDCVISLERPYREVIERFNYNYPKEIICNIDFDRGEFVEDLPDFTTEDGVIQQVKKYDLECWNSLSKQGAANVYDNYENSQIPDAQLYVKKFYENDTEVAREVVIINGTGGDSYYKSQAVPVYIKDKIELSVELFYDNITGTGFSNSPVHVGLFADSGNIYWWKAGNTADPGMKPTWELIPSNIGLINWYETADVDGPHLTMSFTSPPIPESGRLFIFLINFYGSGIEAHYGAVRLNIFPLINGSYRRYIGQTHTLSQDNINIKAVRETEVFISDAPRIAMKGALLKPGPGAAIYTGVADFGSSNTIEIDGNFVGTFPAGLKFSVTGSGFNNFTGRVLSSGYSIIGDLTTIFVDQDTVTEINANIVITEATYVLANEFYNAALHTAGPPSLDDVMPFGKMQSFDVWNQYNRVMRKFEATVDRTDSTTNIPDILHKYILQDINENTTNGVDYRIFQLLHFEMDLHICEWGCFLHECLNTAVAKIYQDHVFKYITE